MRACVWRFRVARAAFHVIFVALMPRSVPVSCRSCRFVRRFHAGCAARAAFHVGFVPLVPLVPRARAWFKPKDFPRNFKLPLLLPSAFLSAKMFGQQAIISRYPVEKICPYPWTVDQVYTIWEKGLRGDMESQGILNLWYDDSHRPIVTYIMLFLGVNHEFGGGTMGAPNVPPPVAGIILDVVKRTYEQLAKKYVLVPYSRRESHKRCIIDYIYRTSINAPSNGIADDLDKRLTRMKHV